jgi:LysR family transcriptional regulator, hypochlorite-specific transcription factor HypT
MFFDGISDVEIKWLEDFLAVASSGSFSRAADARNVTQPAFSRRLKALETWIGVTLLDRSSYPITLTPAGQKLLPVAERVVREIRMARDDVQVRTLSDKSTLKLAMPHALAVGYFPSWWQTVAGSKDNITAKVIADNLHDCVELLVQGGCEFLLCYRNDAIPNPVLADGFAGIAIDTDSLVPVVAPDASGKPLHASNADSARAVPYLSYAADSFLGKVVASLLAAAPVKHPLRLCYESAFAEAVRAQALAGAGIAWLPKRLVAGDLVSGRLLPAGNALPQADLTIWLYRSESPMQPIAESIWHVSSAFPQLETQSNTHAEAT